MDILSTNRLPISVTSVDQLTSEPIYTRDGAKGILTGLRLYIRNGDGTKAHIADLPAIAAWSDGIFVEADRILHQYLQGETERFDLTELVERANDAIEMNARWSKKP